MTCIYVRDVNHYLKMIEVLEKEDQLALDLETYVLKEFECERIDAVDPHKCGISLTCIQGRDTEPIVFDTMLLEQQEGYSPTPLAQLLTTRKDVLVYNGTFEVKFIKKHFGILLRNVYDLRVVQQLIGNATGSKFVMSASRYSLNGMLRDYLGITLEGKDTIRKSGWQVRSDVDSKDWQTKLEYVSGDVKYLFDLYDLLQDVLNKPLPAYDNYDDYGLGLQEIVDLEMEYISVAGEMELNGMPFNLEMYTNYQDALLNPKTRTGEVYNIAATISKKLDIPTETNILNPDKEIPAKAFLGTLNSPIKLKALIIKQTGLKNIDNVQSAVIQRLIDLYAEIEKSGSPDFVNDESELYAELLSIEKSVACEQGELLSLIALYKKLDKQYSTHLSRYYNTVTGCIHPSYDTLRASTGRSSSSRPNSQNISGTIYAPVLTNCIHWLRKC